MQARQERWNMWRMRNWIKMKDQVVKYLLDLRE